MGLDVKVGRDELQGSIDSGELGEIARPHGDRDKAVAFKYNGPRKIRMFVADHSHGIVKAAVAGAVGAAGVAVSAAIILYEHRKGKQE